MTANNLPPTRVVLKPAYRIEDGTKRFLDIVFALLLLILTSPFLILVTVLIPLDSKGGAFFLQKRVGRGETLFTLFKFRTMFIGTPDLPTDQMIRQQKSPITRIGKCLRRFSIDELPQLVNILRGEMSLVGPRPALPTQTFVNERRRAAGVDTLLPGLTGWAQVHGRDELDDTTKVAYDVYYLENRSLWLDLMILAKTFLPLLTGRGNR